MFAIHDTVLRLGRRLFSDGRFPPQRLLRLTGSGVLAALAVSLAPTAADGEHEAQAPRVELVFIGANHNLSFLHPGFTPAHIRALLSKIKPSALLLELLPGWRRDLGIPTFPQEEYAAITWAERVGVPIVGVDWATPAVRALPDTQGMTPLEPGARQARFEAFQREYRELVMWTALRAFGESQDDLESFQRARLPAAVHAWPDEEAGAAERDDGIAENIRRAIERFPGRRIAIVFGDYHYLPQKRRLERSTGVRVVSAAAYLPLDPAQVAAAWHRDDAVVLLGTNLDDWRGLGAPHSRNHQRTKELLDRLRREQPDAVVTHYYEARWRQLLGDADGARAVLDRIVGEGGETRLPHRPDARWAWPLLRTYQQKARFWLAAALDLAGDREAALRHYRALLALPEDQLVLPGLLWDRYVDLRPYLESFLEEPFRGGILEAFRAARATGR